MPSLAYTRFEVIRMMRTPRTWLFSLVFPLALYYVLAVPSRNVHDFAGTGIAVVVYYMVSMATWGAMGAMVAGGGRIAADRAVGWNRQLRITPLSVREYLIGKVLVSYALAIVAMVLLATAALTLGANFDAGRLLEMFALMLVGLVPFALFGVALGHLILPDAVGPIMGGVLGLLPLVSGTWYPVPDHGFLHELAQVLPSYWLTQASHVAVGGEAWGARGWVVIVIWSLAMGRAAMWAYRRDTART